VFARIGPDYDLTYREYRSREIAGALVCRPTIQRIVRAGQVTSRAQVVNPDQHRMICRSFTNHEVGRAKLIRDPLGHFSAFPEHLDSRRP
jgi:hypothetical protein